MAVITTGFFDGVHLGHRYILSQLVAEAMARGEEAVVVTFWPHPRTVLQQDARDLRLLSSLEEKKALLLAAGIDRIEVVPFTRDFAAMTAREYLDMLRDRYGASLVVMGYDNRIGSDRRTFSDLLVEGYSSENASASLRPLPQPSAAGPSLLCCRGWHNFQRTTLHQHTDPSLCSTELPDAFCCHTERAKRVERISSTQIRKALMAGDVETANAMLGYRYGLHGVVVAGNRLGRTIGFPTANMKLYEPLKLVPAGGVYAVDVQVLGRNLKGMCNIGVRPTVGATNGLTIETNIFDFGEDIYGLDIDISFCARIREERKFSSLEELRMQLEEDRRTCLAFKK